jgi:hypothetical protein
MSDLRDAFDAYRSDDALTEEEASAILYDHIARAERIEAAATEAKQAVAYAITVATYQPAATGLEDAHNALDSALAPVTEEP